MKLREVFLLLVCSLAVALWQVYELRPAPAPSPLQVLARMGRQAGA